METTPNDLRQQQFDIKMRGYNPDDVEVFRDLAANALEEARAEVLKLTEENRHLQERLKHLVALEETLKATVIEAQRNADVTLANARKEAEDIILRAKKNAELVNREAELRRNEVTGEMQKQVGKLVADINKIRFIKSNYLASLKNLIDTQKQMVDSLIAEDGRETSERKRTMPQTPRHTAPKPPAPEPAQAPEGEPQPPETEMHPEPAPQHVYQATYGASQQQGAATPSVNDAASPEGGTDDADRRNPETPGDKSDRTTNGDDWEHLKEHLSEE